MKKKKLILSISAITVLSAMTLSIFSYTEKSNAKATKENELKLTEAIANRDIELVGKLVSDKQTSLGVNKNGVTPLDLAIMNQDYKIASILLERGANISSQSDNPLFVTLMFSLGVQNDEQSYKEAINMVYTALAEHKDKLKDTNSRGNTAIHIAALLGLTDMVDLLMKEGLDPEQPNNDGETPAHIASQEGHTKVIELLEKRNPELLKVKDESGNTLITAAAINLRGELLKELMEKIPQLINEQNNEGKTALMYASEYGATDLVQTLLEAGADSLIKDKEQKTAAILAKEWNHAEIVKLLNK